MMSAVATQAVLFDLDNTLYDRDETFLRWAQGFVRERLGLRQDAAATGAVEELVRMDASGYCPRPEFFRWVKRQHPALVATVEELVAAFYREHVTYLALGDDTRRLLDGLAAAGIPFGIATNGKASQLLKVHQLGLDKLTSCIYVSEIAGCRKPAPAIFLAAAGCLGTNPREILFIGDNPEADIAGAAAVGMRTAWLHRGRAWPAGLAATPPDYTIGSLTELLWVAKGMNQPG